MMVEQPATGTQKAPEQQEKWWLWALFGVAALAAAPFVFDYLAEKERTGESFRINWMFALIYDLLGKWGVAAVLAALGVVCLVLSVRYFRRRPR